MKEELKTLKDSAEKIVTERENFKKQRLFFNMKVEEKVKQLGIDEIFAANNDSYDAAITLNFAFPEIYTMASIIREEHPKYGNKRIKQIMIDKLKSQKVELSDNTVEAFCKVIDNYFLYESCGFFELKAKEDKIVSLEENTKQSTKAILDESKNTIVKVGNSALNIVKPYGEVAKSQLKDAGVAAKSLVNKGSKQLIKLLQKVDDKTSN